MSCKYKWTTSQCDIKESLTEYVNTKGVYEYKAPENTNMIEKQWVFNIDN